MSHILMPQLGESVTEGTIGKWLKRVGDPVGKYEPLAEVITDKVNAEIPSDFEGVLAEILVEEGGTVKVGTPIAVIADEAPYAASSSRFSPAVMRLLQEHGIAPSQIKGSGLGGRITRKDVLAYLENRNPSQKLGLTKTEEDLSSVAAPAKPATGLTELGETQGMAPAKQETAMPISGIRRTIAKRMVAAKQEVPHAWTMMEADVTRMVRFREKVKEEFRKKEGVPLTFLPLFIKAVVESIKEYPILNSQWAEDKIIIKHQVNISIAVATDDALFVPVIHQADRLSVAGLAHAIHDLATRARTGTLTADDMAGGTFTVNNTGAFGSILSQPILNLPQAAILTMEGIVKRPVITADDSIAIRHMMNICLTLDHRVLDGLICGRFLASLKKRLENMSEDTLSLY